MKRRRRQPAQPAATLEVEISALGFLGDGVADHGGERLLVPMALPGERWRIRRRGKIVEAVACLVAAPVRQAPVCPHFGFCGGCALQHLPTACYDALKIRRIEGALAARGLAAPGPMTLHKSPLGSRRRLRLGFTGDGRLGFRRRAAREIVEVTVCPIALPALVAVIQPLRHCLRRLKAAQRGGEVTLTALDSGPEVVLHLTGEPDLADREALAAFAEAQQLVRLAVSVGAGEPLPLVVRGAATLTIAGEPVRVPPAAFLQATLAGERVLQAFIARHLEGARKVVDLFAGVGTLGRALLTHGATLRAFDAAPELVAACRHPHLEATRRDLFAAPLQPDELRGVDAVILDPPRAGALAQVEALAESRVPRLIYAACEPATFARDAAVLVAAGYRLVALDAVDQFVFAPEIELGASFVRDPT